MNDTKTGGFEETCIELDVPLQEFNLGAFLKNYLLDVVTAKSLRAILHSIVTFSDLPLIRRQAEVFVERAGYISDEDERKTFLKECDVVRTQLRAVLPKVPERKERINVILTAVAEAERRARALKF
jgi:hypothetical protein